MCVNFLIVNSYYIVVFHNLSLNEISREYSYILTETDKLGFVQLTMESSDIDFNSYFHYLDGRTGPGPSSQEEGLFDRLSLTTHMSG